MPGEAGGKKGSVKGINKRMLASKKKEKNVWARRGRERHYTAAGGAAGVAGVRKWRGINLAEEEERKRSVVKRGREKKER